MKQSNTPRLEIACDAVHSAIVAAEHGADRIELCDSLEQGGITPSAAKIKLLKSKLQIPIFVLIRPRRGDFVYDAYELETMLLNIQLAKSLGADGIVGGALNKHGHIHVEQTLELIEATRPLPFTFHRAFDRCIQPIEAINDLIQLGCDRILTSGQQPTAVVGVDLLQRLMAIAANDVQFVIGGGVRSYNLTSLLALPKVEAFHSSAKRVVAAAQNKGQYHLMDTTEDLKRFEVDEAEVARMKAILHKAI